MKILMISSIAPENEGRFSRAIEDLYSEHEVSILVPKTSIKMKNIHVFNIDYRAPRGVLEQIRFLYSIYRLSGKLKHHTYDMVYVANYTASIYAYFLLKWINIKFVAYDAYELLVKIRGEKVSPRERIFLYFESRIVYKADIIIAANISRALIMQGYYRMERTPFIVSNAPQKIDFDLVQKIYIKKMCKVKKDTVIIYAGYISNTRGIDKLINAVGELGEGYLLNLYGSGPSLDVLKEMIALKKYKNINIYGKYRQENLPQYLMESDIGFIGYPNKGLNNIFCEPNKIYDYSKYLVPMVSTPHVSLERIFLRTGIGAINKDLKTAIQEVESKLRMYIDSCRVFNMEYQNNDEREQVREAILQMEKDVAQNCS